MKATTSVFAAAAFTIAVAFAGTAYVFRENLDFYIRTGHFSPISIVETLQSPVAVTEFDGAVVLAADGKEIALPGQGAAIAPPDSVVRDVKAHGVEIAPDGTVFALVRVHHWCGNDPVRRHLARVDLASLMISIGERGDHGDSGYGVDPGLLSSARIPHHDLMAMSRAGAASEPVLEIPLDLPPGPPSTRVENDGETVSARE
jgi:hypothetical protein